MEVIYLDRLFAINFLADYLLCLSSARICGCVLKRRRYVLAALFGSVYAAALFLPIPAFFRLPACKIGCGVIMAAICCAGEAHFLRCAGVFFAAAAGFGGAMEYIGAGRADIRLFCAAFVLCYTVFDLLFRFRAKQAESRHIFVRLRFLGRESCFYALRDTGNSLRDPTNGEKVITVSLRAVENLFGDFAPYLRLDPAALVMKSAEFPSLRGKLRLLPFSSVGGSGLMCVFRPETLCFDGEEQTETLVAISPALCEDSFDALI